MKIGQEVDKMINHPKIIKVMFVFLFLLLLWIVISLAIDAYTSPRIVNAWPLELDPPVVEVLSDWNRTNIGDYRYIKIDGQLAIQYGIASGGSIAFVPHQPTRIITKPTTRN